MSIKEKLQHWVLQAIDDNGGRATVVDVAKHIWDHHEGELRSGGEAFYTWQYDMRWAAQYLRDKGILTDAKKTKRGIWEKEIAKA